jgi:DNA-directed RNA polymerase subunit RPC12/RpoP
MNNGHEHPGARVMTDDWESRFVSQLDAQQHRCSSCNGAIEGMADFTSDRARREFALSGLCQRCQDGVFRSPMADEVLECPRCGSPDLVRDDDVEEESCRSCGHWWSVAEDDE